MNWTTISIESAHEGKTAILRLNRPALKNAMNKQMSVDIRAALKKITKNDKYEVVILTGAGDVFSAGGDFEMLASFSKNTWKYNKKNMIKFYGSFLSILDLPQPVIAAVNGHAMGAALAISCACDLRLYSKNSKYAFNFLKLSLHPGMGASYFAPTLFGSGLGSQLLYSGRFITEQEMLSSGTAYAFFHRELVLDESLKLAEQLHHSGRPALRSLKKGLVKKSKKALLKILKHEAASQADSYQTEEYREMMARLAK